MLPFSWSFRNWVQAFAVVLGGMLCGWATWWASPHVIGQPRPWDGGPWQCIYVMAGAGFLVTLMFPKGFWLAPLSVFAGQFLYGLYLYEPENSFRFPLDIAQSFAFSMTAGVGSLSAAIFVGILLMVFGAIRTVWGWTSRTSANSDSKSNDRR